MRRPTRLLLAALLILVLGPAPIRAEEGEARAGVAQDEPAARDEVDATREEEETAVEPPAGAARVAPPPGVDVIRVKGRTVTAIETEVPTSVTQFDAAALEALGAQDISDLAKVTPNLEIKSAGATAPTFFIRGVGLSDFNANAAGAVSVYYDDVARNAPAIQLGQLFDVENVEVLKGPQGGGSGRNASAGAIKISSRKPTGDLAAELRATGGRFDFRDFEGALELPLVEETLATRLAFRFTQRDPYVSNGCGNAPPVEERLVTGQYPNPDPPPKNLRRTVKDVAICGERAAIPSNGGISPIPEGLPSKVNDLGVWSARGQLRFQPPGTDMDWLLNAHGSRLDQMSTLGQAVGTRGDFFGGTTGAESPYGGYKDPDIVEMQTALIEQLKAQYPGLPLSEITDLMRPMLSDELARNLDIRPFRGDYDRVGQTTLDHWGGFLRGDGSIGSFDFTSITGYDGYDRFRDQDQDFTPDVLFEAVSEDEAWQLTQELRLAGELPETPLRWEAGGYYLMEQLDVRAESFLPEAALSPLRVYEQDLWSFAFFAGFSWDFLDDFTLEGGARYNWERKDFDFTLTRPNATNDTPRHTVDSRIWQAPTGTLTLRYRFGEDSSVYWKYSRGWKGGHFNASANESREVVAVEPETIDAFEAGLRGRWLDGRIGFSASLFYYSYGNYQVFVVEDDLGAPPTYLVINANDAEVYGSEIEMRAEPIDGLVLSGRFSWLESQFLDFTNEIFHSVIVDFGPPAIDAVLPVTVDFTGNRLISSPRFKASGAAEWTLDLGRWGSWIPRYDFAWSDDIFFDPSEGRGTPNPQGVTTLPEYTAGQRAFWLHNARLTYRTPDGNIEVAGWVRNFTDEVYKTFAFDASNFSDVVINFVGEPRTFGVTVSIRW